MKKTFENIDLKSLHERELHPFLVYYLANNLNIYTKTIYHEVSSKIGKGKSEWLHPDIVGFDLPAANLDEKVLELCGTFSISRATIYSFELKKQITSETLREQFFQAVSNSSWANEGYLVAADIDTENPELMQEINRLASAFNIGVIKLDLLNPDSSKIIVKARRKESLDAETMNKLASVNRDFRDFVQIVLKSISINQFILNGLDQIMSISDLDIVLNNALKEETNKLKTHETPEHIVKEKVYNVENDEFIEERKVQFGDDVTGKTARGIKIGNDKLDATTWKELYLSVCNYLINIDKSKFLQAKDSIKGRKGLYFAEKSEMVRIAHFIESVEIYVEINLSAQTIVRNIKKLLEFYDININDVNLLIN